jgi:hypothetical protein
MKTKQDKRGFELDRTQTLPAIPETGELLAQLPEQLARLESAPVGTTWSEAERAVRP